MQIRFWMESPEEYGYTYSTSSARYTEEIADRLGVSHTECNRIENHFSDVENAIELEEEGDNSE